MDATDRFVAASLEAHLIYGLVWIGFGVLHSLLARELVKRRLRPLFGAGYRFAYGVFAVATFGVVIGAGEVLFRHGAHWDWPLAVDVLRWAVVLAGFGVLIVVGRGYDLDRFTGLRQLRNRRRGIAEPEDEPLRLDGLHRYVRHPLYFGLVLILWGIVDDEERLALAVWASLYIVIGLWFEERDLIRLHGARYRAYRARVPALIPWRGRAVD